MLPLALALATAHATSRDLSPEPPVAATEEATAPPQAPEPKANPEQLLFHGFRVGYTYVNIDDNIRHRVVRQRGKHCAITTRKTTYLSPV